MGSTSTFSEIRAHFTRKVAKQTVDASTFRVSRDGKPVSGSLTIVESDPELASGLRQRFPEADIRDGDATATGFKPDSYDTVVCFTMLHHVSPPALQDKLFAEAARVLKPGGWFAGTDSRVDRPSPVI